MRMLSPAAAAVATLVGLWDASAANAQNTMQSQPAKKAVKQKNAQLTEREATPELDPLAPPSKEKKLSLCLETWDAATHMTKKEWRIACQRSIRDYPDAFDR
jgi:hypothetical protein